MRQIGVNAMVHAKNSDVLRKPNVFMKGNRADDDTTNSGMHFIMKNNIAHSIVYDNALLDSAIATEFEPVKGDQIESRAPADAPFEIFRKDQNQPNVPPDSG